MLKTARSYLYSSGHNTGTWQTDGQTECLWLSQRFALRAMRMRCKNEHLGMSAILDFCWKLISAESSASELTRHHHVYSQRNRAMRRWIIVISKFSAALRDAATLTFGPLTFKVCSTSGVVCRLQTLSEIEHFAAELFTIYRVFAVQFLMGAHIPEQLSRVRGPNFIKLDEMIRSPSALAAFICDFRRYLALLQNASGTKASSI